MTVPVTVLAHPAALAGLDMYLMWRDAPALAGQFDPFDFSHRMSIYRHLIDTTNRAGTFGVDNAQNPLWGLMFQHQWQFRSGRLGKQEGGAYDIDPDAPWGYGNYALCTIPFIGAVQAGAVEDLEILPPRSPNRFDYVVGGGTAGPRILVPAFQPAVDDWADFFTLVLGSRPGDDHEPLRLALWRAHKTSLDVVAARLDTLEPKDDAPLELAFLRGWCRMVDYLWAAAWLTDFQFMVGHGLDVLPERMLTDADANLALSDLPKKVRKNVRNVVGLSQTSPLRHRLNLWLWRRAMRTRAARNEVGDMLDALFNHNPGNIAARRRMLRYLVGI